jgi:hypothetical protein
LVIAFTKAKFWLKTGIKISGDVPMIPPQKQMPLLYNPIYSQTIDADEVIATTGNHYQNTP